MTKVLLISLVVALAGCKTTLMDDERLRLYVMDCGELADNPKRLLDGDRDVFGDGSVMIISAPGHTPGHQEWFVDLEETGPLVLSGDLNHFRISREQMRVPPFNADKAQTLDSMRKVERLVEERGATLWIEHDMALARALNLAPAYYE